MDTTSGIKNADPEELKRVASQPTSDFFFFVNDFSILRTLLPLISRRVCTTAGGVPVTLPCKLLPILGTLILAWERRPVHSSPLTYTVPQPPSQPMTLRLGPGTWCCLSQVANPYEYSGQQPVAL